MQLGNDWSDYCFIAFDERLEDTVYDSIANSSDNADSGSIAVVVGCGRRGISIQLGQPSGREPIERADPSRFGRLPRHFRDFPKAALQPLILEMDSIRSVEPIEGSKPIPV
ncbi:MAG: hypothetical protein VYC82_05215 [Verrucomicrobiota bacterium]|nr:hypothetical protein [Verrucomicrobiota bacterium]